MVSDIVLICVDRDGTINLDENHYLGSKEDWEKHIKFLPGVIPGLKILNRIPNSKIVIITNQSGVALGGEEFEKLTEKRLKEVNYEIIKRLKAKGANIDASFSCPYVDESYVKKAESKGRVVIKKYVKDNHPDKKPNIGMIIKAAKRYGKELKEIKHKFMIGDRYTDIETGLKAGCTSILITSYKTKELGDEEKTKKLKEYLKSVFIAKDFSQAAKLIRNLTK